MSDELCECEAIENMADEQRQRTAELMRQHGESRKILDAVSRLSPDVRELLVSNPEAVEKCVRAVKVTIKSRTPGESTTYSQSLQSMNAAIAALKPGRDEG